MHAAAVPVAFDGFGVQIQRDVVLFTDSDHDVARQPDLVSSGLSTLGKDLVLPRSEHDFSVDTFNVQTGLNACIGVFFHDISSGNVLGSDAAVVGSLRSGVVGFSWPSDWVSGSVVDEHVFLLVAEPEILIIVVDQSPGVRLVGGFVGVQYLAHHKAGILSARIVTYADWFE